MSSFRVPELYPAIDLLDGRVVRLRRGDFAEPTDYGEDALGYARRFEQAGARAVHVVDLDGASSGRGRNGRVIRDIVRSTGLLVQTGGGVRREEDLRFRLDELGVARVVVGTALVDGADWVRAQLERDASRLAFGVDVRGGEALVRGWQEGSGMSALALLSLYEDSPPPGAVIYTCVEGDGMLSGVSVAGAFGLARCARCPVVLSGGVGSLLDVRRALAPFVSGAGGESFASGGVVVGRALVEQKFSLEEALGVLDGSTRGALVEG